MDYWGGGGGGKGYVGAPLKLLGRGGGGGSSYAYDLILDFCVKTRTRFSLRDKRLFEIIEVKITRVDCI